MASLRLEQGSETHATDAGDAGGWPRSLVGVARRPATAHAQRYPRFLDALDPRDGAQLRAIATEKRVRKGQFLFHQGDPSDAVFIIVSGGVKVLYIHDEGAALTGLYYREGMLVGAHGCTEWSGDHAWSAQALADCDLLRIRRAEFLDFVRAAPGAMLGVLAITEFKNEQLKKVIRVLAQPTLEDRIVMAVRHFGALYGVDRGGEIEIDGHITHQEIAEMVGASRQSVTTLLVALERSGAIRREGRRLFVPARTAEA